MAYFRSVSVRSLVYSTVLHGQAAEELHIHNDRMDIAKEQWPSTQIECRAEFQPICNSSHI